MRTRIKAVVVVIPAHDEQHLLPDCLRSVARALRRVPDDVRTHVCVVADRCADATEARALSLAGLFDGFSLLVNSVSRDLGEVRNLGAARVFHASPPFAPEATWLLHTDADTVVPTDWVLGHLRYAEQGVHAVAGRAVIRHWTGPAARVRHCYEALVAERISADRHYHVYGANLGVRADVFGSAGGFPPISTGEDRALWRWLVRTGRMTRQPNELRVFTSDRTQGRAHGGLAALLHELSTHSQHEPVIGTLPAFGLSHGR